MRVHYGLIFSLLLFQISIVKAEDLLTIYSQALESDPELQMAGYKVQIGAARKGQALGGMLPQIVANTNWSQNNQIVGKKPANYPNVPFDSTNHYNGTRYNVSLTQSLLDFAKFWDWRRAQREEDQFTYENIAVQHDVMFNVVEKYFNVLEAEDKLFYLRAEEGSTLKQLEQVQKQYAKQLILITDVYEVEARVDLLKANIIEAATELVIAKESLKELTNSEPISLYKLREEIDYVKLDGNLEDWIDVAKSENPVLAAQINAIAAADNNVKVQKSKHLPVVDMQMSYNQTNTGYQSINLGNSYDTTVGAINVSIPLFSGGVTSNQMYEAQHKLSISHSENEAKIRALIKETSDTFLSTNASVQRISASRKALESAVKSRESLETSFNYGEQTISDVLDAQRNEYIAKRELSIAKYTFIKNKIRFFRATGLITEENLVEVNSWLINKPNKVN